MDSSLSHYVVFFFVSYHSFSFKVYFCQIKLLLTQHFFPVCVKYLLPSLYFYSVCIFHSEVSIHIDNMYVGLVFLSIQLSNVFWLVYLSHLHLKWLLIGKDLLPFFVCLHYIPLITPFLLPPSPSPSPPPPPLLLRLLLLLHFSPSTLSSRPFNMPHNTGLVVTNSFCFFLSEKFFLF